MPRFSLTISDLAHDEALAVLGGFGPVLLGKPTEVTRDDAPEPARGVRVKRGAPAAIPAGAPAIAAAPTPPVPAAPAAPVPAAPVPAAPVPAAPVPIESAAEGVVTIDSLLAKGRILGKGPLTQMAVLAVLTAMGTPSFVKVPPAQFGDLNALLDVAIAYADTPGATADALKTMCQPGQYDAAIDTLRGVVNSAMGL